MIRLVIVFFLTCGAVVSINAQEFPKEMADALKTDDSVTLSKLITPENINKCYGDYSLLSNAVRSDKLKCFNLLIAQGANVNSSCNGYVTPLMHGAKYGRLAMVKVLVAKGADVKYKYDGAYKPAVGETPYTYAVKHNQEAVAEYLKTFQ